VPARTGRARGRTDTDTANGIEGHARFAGYCLRKQGLSRARRAHDQYTLQNPAAKPAIPFGIAQKSDDLPEFGFSFVDSGNVIESDARFVLHENMCIVAANLRVFLQSARAPQQQIPHNDKRQHRNNP
jgi:hypothetical protein